VRPERARAEEEAVEEVTGEQAAVEQVHVEPVQAEQAPQRAEGSPAAVLPGEALQERAAWAQVSASRVR
jgi:hypothetical protein